MTKKLFKEAETIKFGLKIESGLTNPSLSEGWGKAGENLRVFIMENCQGWKEWQEVIDELRQRVEAICKEEEQERLLEEKLKGVRAEMAEMQARYEEKLASYRRGARNTTRREVVCSACGGKNHVSKHCYSKKASENAYNKNNSSYAD